MRVITFRAIIMAMSAAILAYMTIRTFVLAGASAHDDSRVHPLAEKSMREFLEVTDIDEALNKRNCSGSRREADGYLREVGGQIRPVRRAMVTRC